MTLLALRPQNSALDIPPSTWAMMKEQGALLVKSGFLPNAIKTPEQAVTIMLKGRELGIPPMQAFSHIHVIQGKPTISAELMLALIYRECPGAKVEYLKYEGDGCHIKATRPGHQPSIFKFEKADAEAAQLLGKENWRKFARAMYRSRCISEMARSLFPDCIMGCSYTPEELDPDVTVDEEGRVIDVEPTPRAAPKVEPKRVEVVEVKAGPSVNGNGEPMGPPKTQRKVGIYEGTEDQQETFRKILAAKKFPEELWEDFHCRMMNRPSTDYKQVMEELYPA